MKTFIVLHAPLPGHWPPAREQAALAALPYAKRLELERRNAAGRRAGLAGIALAIESASALRGAPVPAGELRFPQDGKPRLAGGPFFSISHTSGRVACAASLEEDCGLDVEFVGDAASFERLQRWTATEAVLKAAGLGLRSSGEVAVEPGLRAARCRGARYYLRAIDLGPQWVGHLAALRPVASLRITERPPAHFAPAG